MIDKMSRKPAEAFYSYEKSMFSVSRMFIVSYPPPESVVSRVRFWFVNLLRINIYIHILVFNRIHKMWCCLSIYNIFRFFFMCIISLSITIHVVFCAGAETARLSAKVNMSFKINSHTMDSTKCIAIQVRG